VTQKRSMCCRCALNENSRAAENEKRRVGLRTLLWLLLLRWCDRFSRRLRNLVTPFMMPELDGVDIHQAGAESQERGSKFFVLKSIRG
jgi:hypothetical protein